MNLEETVCLSISQIVDAREKFRNVWEVQSEVSRVHARYGYIVAINNPDNTIDLGFAVHTLRLKRAPTVTSTLFSTTEKEARFDVNDMVTVIANDIKRLYLKQD